MLVQDTAQAIVITRKDEGPTVTEMVLLPLFVHE
jgi:hypothetical protein